MLKNRQISDNITPRERRRYEKYKKITIEEWFILEKCLKLRKFPTIYFALCLMIFFPAKIFINGIATNKPLIGFLAACIVLFYEVVGALIGSLLIAGLIRLANLDLYKQRIKILRRINK